jgi:hypothetical protein
MQSLAGGGKSALTITLHSGTISATGSYLEAARDQPLHETKLPLCKLWSFNF